jgi:hypothetical protein
MAPMLYHGLVQRGVPAICVESRQAYQRLKSLATHKTDRNDARGLAQLARTGFFKPVHVKSLAAHSTRSLIIARKKLFGQRVTLENQIRGLAVAFGIRLHRSLSPAFIEQALRASDGIDGLSAAMQGSPDLSNTRSMRPFARSVCIVFPDGSHRAQPILQPKIRFAIRPAQNDDASCSKEQAPACSGIFKLITLNCQTGCGRRIICCFEGRARNFKGVGQAGRL